MLDVLRASLGLPGPRQLRPSHTCRRPFSSRARASLPAHTGHSQHVPTLRPRAKTSVSEIQNPTAGGKSKSNARMEATFLHLPAISTIFAGYQALTYLSCRLPKTSWEDQREENTGALGHEPQATCKLAALGPTVGGECVLQ